MGPGQKSGRLQNCGRREWKRGHKILTVWPTVVYSGLCPAQNPKPDHMTSNGVFNNSWQWIQCPGVLPNQILGLVPSYQKSFLTSCEILFISTALNHHAVLRFCGPCFFYIVTLTLFTAHGLNLLGPPLGPLFNPPASRFIMYKRAFSASEAISYGQPLIY